MDDAEAAGRAIEVGPTSSSSSGLKCRRTKMGAAEDLAKSAARIRPQIPPPPGYWLPCLKWRYRKEFQSRLGIHTSTADG